MQWVIGGEENSTSSDHEVIIWEVSEKSKAPALEHFTGWDPSGWDLRGCSEEEAEIHKTKREMAAREWREASANRPLQTLIAESFEEEVAWIRRIIETILDKYARRKRVCALSERWWTQEIADVRKEVGRAKRNRTKRPYALREARKRLRRAIREAKKLYWNKFVSEATGQDMWTGTRYTKPVTEASKRPLRDELGTVATSPEEKHLMIIQSAFPLAPIAVPFHPRGADSAHTMVTKEMWNTSSDGAQTKALAGEDRMGAEIIKTLLGWDADRVTHLVAECIRLGYHPTTWKSARGIVIPKPGEPDYSRVRAYRVIYTRLTREIGRAYSGTPDCRPFRGQPTPT